jgi:outer membrane protein assembly factor BamB
MVATALALALAAAPAAAQLPPLPPLPGVPPGGGNQPPPGDNRPGQERPATPGPGKGDVVSYRGNPQHTEASSDGSVFGPLERLWTVDFDAPPSQPLIAAGRVIVNVPKKGVPSYGSEVVALNPATGKQIWRQPTPGTYFSAHIAIDGDRVVSVNYDGVARAFALADGRPLWTRELAANGTHITIDNAPVARGGTVFVYASGSSYGGTMFALATDTGAVRWSRPIDNISGAMPAVDDRRVFVSDTCGNAAALWQADGVPVWQRPRHAECTYNPSASLLHDGRLWSAAETGWLYDLGSGADRGARPGGAPDAVAGDLGIEQLGDGTIRATDLASAAPRWNYKESGSYQFPLRPVVAGETVFATTAKGNLVGLDRATGELRSITRLRSDTYSSIGGILPGMSVGRGVLVATAGTLLHGYAPVLTPGENTIDMGASSFDVAFGELSTIVGGLGAKLRAGGPRDVVLEADPYPYGKFRVVKRDRSFADGAAWFDARTVRNTRYRVRIPGGTAAKPITVYAYLRSKWKFSRGRTSVGLRISFTGPSDFRAAGRTASVYLFRHKKSRHPRLATGRLVQTGRGRARLVVRFPYLRNVNRKDSTIFCIHGLRSHGRPDDPFNRRCGARSIKARW